MRNRLEQSLKNTGIFHVVTDKLETLLVTDPPFGNFADFGLRVFITGFSDRVEIDLWVYSAFDSQSYNPPLFMIVHALTATVKDISGVLDTMDSLGTEISRTLLPKEEYLSRQVIFVEPFKSNEEAVKKPVRIMFGSKLLATNRFTLLDAGCLDKYNSNNCLINKFNDERATPALNYAGNTILDHHTNGRIHRYYMPKHNLTDFRQAPPKTKRRICQEYYNLEWFIGGKIDPVGNSFQITTTSESPLRHIGEIKTSVSLGTRPEDVRISSINAAKTLLAALEPSSESNPIIFDEIMVASSLKEPTIKSVSLRRQDGKVLNVRVVMAVQRLRSTQRGRWHWGGDSASSGTFGYIVLKVAGSEVANLPIDYTLFYGVHAKKQSALNVGQHGLKLSISEMSCSVTKKDSGAFGLDTTATLNSCQARLILEKE